MFAFYSAVDTNVLPRAVARYTPETYSQLATAIQKNQLGVSDRAGLVGKPVGSWMAMDVGKIVVTRRNLTSW